jgi:predicted acyl esterase
LADHRARGRAAAGAFAALALILGGAATADAAPPLPFGHACAPRFDVVFCPSATLDQRVPSFDGTPIDVDVTLPRSGDGPFPLLVLLHGYGGNKTDAQSKSADDGSRDVYWAKKGYAVVTLSNRGFGNSCGVATSRTPDCQAAGWIHLADQRFEVRDTQELIGKLVDQGIADPGRIGVTGPSYGGGQAVTLAFLRDRIRLPDGSFAAWKSPKGTPLVIAAAVPQVPWADLAAALMPNGRWTDDRPYQASLELDPPGVPIKSYINGLYFAGDRAGWVAPIGSDPQADLAGWRKLLVDDGEPYGADAVAVGRKMQRYHSGVSLDGEPAPLLVMNGWTDDLFPAPHALRIYNTVRARDPKAPISIILGAFGHSRGGEDPATSKLVAGAQERFIDAYVKGDGDPPAAGGVAAALTTCPKGSPAKIYRAPSWDKIARGAFAMSYRKAQTVRSTGGDPTLGKAFDPLGGADACTRTKARKPKGDAFVQDDAGRGLTMIGRTEITAAIEANGRDGQLAGRLWDIDPKTKTMRLADRGILRLRPNQKGRIRFQLNGDGYHFAAGHLLRLELSGSDADYYRPSNTPFTVKVSDLSAFIPTR